MCIYTRIFAFTLFALFLCFIGSARADYLPAINLNADQMTALLGDVSFRQDGITLDLDKLNIRFLEKVDDTLPGLPPIEAVPLALEEEVKFADLSSVVTQQLTTSWATQLPHSCNDRNTFYPDTVKIQQVTISDIVITFSAHYGKFACWSFDAPKCSLSWKSQKCKIGLVSGNTLIFQKTINFRLDLHLTYNDNGLTLTPSVDATNVADIDRLVSVINFLRPLLQFSLGSAISPTIGVLFTLPQVKIIPKLKGPNERLHELGVVPYNLSLDRLSAEQKEKMDQLTLGKDAAGASHVGLRLQAMKIKNASFLWHDDQLYMELLMATPNKNSPSVTEAVLDRDGLIAVIDGLTKYQSSERNPIKQYVVESGDTMWKIADKLYGNPYLHLAIAEQNTERRPAKIFPGQSLNVMPYSSMVDGIDRLVGNGDSSWSLASSTLGAGERYQSIDVGSRNCGGARLIYPGELWRVQSGPPCKVRSP